MVLPHIRGIPRSTAKGDNGRAHPASRFYQVSETPARSLSLARVWMSHVVRAGDGRDLQLLLSRMPSGRLHQTIWKVIRQAGKAGRRKIELNPTKTVSCCGVEDK